MKIKSKNLSGIFQIIKAELEHIDAISKLTEGKNLLSKTAKEITELRPNFLVLINEKNEVLGCVGSKYYNLDAEIISFRVLDEYQGQGFGKKLLKKIIQNLETDKKLRIFSLTTRAVAEIHFFPSGFFEVGIQLFNLKVSEVCKKCPKNIILNNQHQCNEIAVLYKGKETLVTE